MPFNYRSNYHKLYFIDIKAFFPNYCLNFLLNMIYIYQNIFLWEFITIINLQKEASLWRSKPKRKKLAEKKAKRLAKIGPKKMKTHKSRWIPQSQLP